MAKLSDLFNVEYGSSFDLARVEEIDVKNGIPYISRTEKNNGVSTYLSRLDDSIKLNSAHTLTVALGGSVLEAFYQSEPYYTGYHISVLTPLREMTKEQMIYYAMCIKENKIKYSYGRQANRTIRSIELPDFEDIPSWVNEHKIGNIELIDTTPEVKIKQSLCEDVHIFTLFEVERGKSKPISELSQNLGDTPVVSSSEFNNGITTYTGFEPDFDGNCLTLAINGSIGSCFYQRLPFIATQDVAVLKPKFTMNKYHAVYIATLLKQEGTLKYSYGRKWDVDQVKNTQLKMPIKEGEVDWKLVEDYMKNIEAKYRITKNSKPSSSI